MERFTPVHVPVGRDFCRVAATHGIQRAQASSDTTRSYAVTSTVLTSAAMASISALTIGSLAYLCAKRRSVAIFLASVILLWGVVSWTLGHYSNIASVSPARIPEWRHVLATFLGIGPLVLSPTAFTIGPVLGHRRMTPRSISPGKIPCRRAWCGFLCWVRAVCLYHSWPGGLGARLQR